MDYKELLEHSYSAERENGSCAPESRMEYLSQYIFDFTTYDGAMDVLFARKAVEVCGAITNGSTFEYIKTAESYQWFLLMCNMPFFADRLNWGGSIRGAWWDGAAGKAMGLQSYGLWDGDKQMTDALKFTSDEWHQFMRAMVEFASVEICSGNAK